MVTVRRWLAATRRHRRSPLSARRLLARGGLQPADVGAARHGGHTPRRRLLRLPLVASLAGPGGRCGMGPPTPGLPTLSLSLVGGSRPCQWAGSHSSRPCQLAGRSTDIRLQFTPCGVRVYLWLRVESRAEPEIINVSYRMDSDIAPERHSASVERVHSSSVFGTCVISWGSRRHSAI